MPLSAGSRTLLLLLAGCILLAGPRVIRANESLTARYFQGLRDRNLLDLAEGELLGRLSEAGVSVSEQAEFTRELAITFGQHALYTQDEEQADLWDRAGGLLAEFLDSHQAFPERDSLRVLRGKLLFERGRAQRWIVELQPEHPQARTDAVESLGKAIELLSALEPELGKHLKIQRHGAVTALVLASEAQIHALLRETRQTLGEAELELARLQEPEQRAGHLERAEKWFQAVLTGGGTPGELWPGRVGLAESARLGGRLDAVRGRLADIDAVNLGVDAKDAVAHVMGQLLIDEGKPDQAVTFLISYRRERGSLTGALRLLQIEALAAGAELLTSRDQKAAADALREEIGTVVNWTDAEHGGYWAYRARLAARHATRQATFGSELLTVLRQARTALDAGEKGEAAEFYRQASELAEDPTQAAQFALSEGRLLLQDGQYERASQRLASLVEEFPDLPEGEDAHFLSATALGYWHDQQPSAERREAYMARLAEHMERFPTSPTAARAAIRMARVHEHRRQFTQTLPLLRQGLGDASSGALAAAMIARNYERILDHLTMAARAATEPGLRAVRLGQHAEWLDQAQVELLDLTESLRSSGEVEPLSTFEAELAIRAARILIVNAGNLEAASALVERLHTSLAEAHPEADAEFWKAMQRSIVPLHIVALTHQGNTQLAGQELRNLEQAPLGDVLFVYRALLSLEHNTPGAASPRIEFGVHDGPIGPRAGDLRASLQSLFALRGKSLSDKERRELESALARIETDAGRADLAAHRYQALVEANPSDGQLLEQAARDLSASDDERAVTLARSYWEQIERRHSPGSEPWMEARAEVIATSLALGDVARARKLLVVTRLVHPEFGGGKHQQRFKAFEKQFADRSEESPPQR